MNCGNLLIATPKIIGDHDFHRSVIIITSLDDENISGHIINKKLNYNLNNLIEDIKPPIPLFYGGPVETDRLFFIHKSSIKIPESKKISNHINWCGDLDMTIKLINDKTISSNDIMFFLGYSGWDRSQLESEFIDKSWRLFRNDISNYLFQKNIVNIWKDCIKSFGNDYILWFNTPNNPNHN
ncbi:MAG: transcriptional regulator [Flavobacteriaceae bacterium]|nr:transcriptional regulator [Flavobacteriaceae bacterium]|tara:strand:- start:7334 stop:7879 length:546 start_codon:yes stop_codon:yes gene_type:complete